MQPLHIWILTLNSLSSYVYCAFWYQPIVPFHSFLSFFHCFIPLLFIQDLTCSILLNFNNRIYPMTFEIQFMQIRNFGENIRENINSLFLILYRHSSLFLYIYKNDKFYFIQNVFHENHVSNSMKSGGIDCYLGNRIKSLSVIRINGVKRWTQFEDGSFEWREKKIYQSKSELRGWNYWKNARRVLKYALLWWLIYSTLY